MLRNITKREKLLAGAAVSIIIAAAAYNFIIDPVIGHWNDLDKKIRDKDAMLKKHSRILRDRPNIEKLRAQYAKYFELKRPTPEEESAAALSLIDKTARETRVQITNIKPVAPKSFENYNKFTFRVSTESKMSEFIKFVYDLQSSDQLLRVEKMVVRAKENDPSTIKSVLNITKISVF